MKTKSWIDKFEVERDIRACSHQEVQDLALMDVRHLQEVYNAEDDAFIQQSFLHLRELKYYRNQSGQVVLGFWRDLEDVLKATEGNLNDVFV